MIKLNNITLKFDKNPVIENFSYTFNDTGFYAIKGESGSGKTTLLNAIAGFVKPVSGSIKYDSSTLNINSSISLIFQDNNLFEDLTVKENIEMIISLSNTKVEDNDIINMLTNLKIEQYLNTKVSNISGGERTRVSIAIALLQGKKVIIADEPLSSLDEENSNNIMSLLKELSKERLIILTCHNSYILEEYADYIIDLSNKEQYQENDNTEYELYDSVDNKKKLKVKEVFNIYRKVIKEKAIFKVLLGIMLSVTFAIMIFSFSLMTYSMSKVMLKKIDDNKLNYCFLESFEVNLEIPKDYLNDVEQYRVTGSNINRTEIKNATQKTTFPYAPDMLTVIKRTVINNSIAEDEIIITDFVAYSLEGYGVIDLKNKKASDAVGQEITIFSRYDDEDGSTKTYTLKIKDVITTGFTKIYESGESIDDSEYSDTSIYLYSFCMMNEKSLYNIQERYNKTSDFITSADTSINFELIIDSTLSDNECIISNYLLDEINSAKGTNYNIGDTATFEIEDIIYNTYIEKIECKIKNIDYDRSEYSKYSIVVNANTYNEMMYLTSRAHNQSGNFYFSFDDVSDIKDIINYAVDNNCNLSFDGAQYIYELFDTLNLTRNIMSISCLVMIILSMFLIIYSMISTDKMNKTRMNTLIIYGMNKKYISLFMLLKYILIGIISMFLGSLFAYLLNTLFDYYLVNFENVTLYYHTFNATTIIYAVLIFIVFLSITLIIGQIINKKRKVRTHLVKNN